MAATARHFEVMRLLRGSEGLSLLALSKRLGVAKNTVQRDIDHLCAAGVGIAEEKRGQTVLYRLEEATPAPLQSALDAATLAPVLAVLKPWRRSGWVKDLLTRLELDQERSAPECRSPASLRTPRVRGSTSRTARPRRAWWRAPSASIPKGPRWSPS